MTSLEELDDIVVATAELGGRTGGRSFEIGYLNDDEPNEWYVKATYKGDRVIVEGFDRPDDACDAFCERILSGGRCTHCGGVTVTALAWDRDGGVATSDIEVNVDPANLDRAARRRIERQRAKGVDTAVCVWHREGKTWVRGCADPRIPIPRRTTDEPWRPNLSVTGKGTVFCDDHDAEYVLCMLTHKKEHKP